MPRQRLDAKTAILLTKEIRKQKLHVTRASKQRMGEMVAISRWIQKQGLPKYLVCRKLPGKLGRGIFLRANAKPIERHQMIAPYAGDISVVPEYAEDDSAYVFSPVSKFRLSREEQRLFDPKGCYHPRRLYSIKLDALRRGNFTRFINHSEEPNIIACAFRTPQRNPFGLEAAPIEIVYIAKRRIYPGEQLLISYEPEEKSYWGAFGIRPYPMTAKTFQIAPSLRLICNRK